MNKYYLIPVYPIGVLWLCSFIHDTFNLAEHPTYMFPLLSTYTISVIYATFIGIHIAEKK